MKRKLPLLLVLVTTVVAISSCGLFDLMFPGTWEELGDNRALGNDASFIDMGIDEVTGTIYVAFQDGSANSVSVIKYEEFGSQAWEYVGYRYITGNNVVAKYISLLVDDGTPIISFRDESLADPGLSVMEFNGSAWEYVGPPTGGGISSTNVTNSSLLVDAGTLYVAYRENRTTNNLIVSEFNGSTWSPYAGDPGVAANDGPRDYIDLQEHGGTMFVSYSANNASGGSGDISVLSTTGSGWTPVGGHDIYGAEAQSGNMFFGDGTLYMAFDEKGGPAVVMSFENPQWAPVDQPTISSGEAQYVAADYYEGDIIIAYRDEDIGSRLTAQKYNGRRWSYLGDPGFSPGIANWVALATGNAGYYVAFADVTDGGKVKVYVYH